MILKKEKITCGSYISIKKSIIENSDISCINISEEYSIHDSRIYSCDIHDTISIIVQNSSLDKVKVEKLFNKEHDGVNPNKNKYKNKQIVMNIHYSELENSEFIMKDMLDDTYTENYTSIVINDTIIKNSSFNNCSGIFINAYNNSIISERYYGPRIINCKFYNLTKHTKIENIELLNSIWDGNNNLPIFIIYNDICISQINNIMSGFYNSHTHVLIHRVNNMEIINNSDEIMEIILKLIINDPMFLYKNRKSGTSDDLKHIIGLFKDEILNGVMKNISTI